jgi:hypothetical protein
MLQPGDIVLSRFDNDDGTKKFRPALVIEVALDEDLGGVMIRLAYGTSRNVGRCVPWEFSIGPEDGSGWVASGLLVATKFELNTFRWVPEKACRRVGCVSHSIGGRMMDAARAAVFKGYLSR